MGLIKPVLLRPSSQELGKIKIGGRSGGRDGRPVTFDAFQITTMERDDKGNFCIDKRIHSHEDVGPAPTELAGLLMHVTPAENFHSEMQVYRGRTKKVWTCDGEEATDLEKGEVVPCPRLVGGRCNCKPYGRLHLQLWAAPWTLGYHVFRTTSWTSVSNIQTALSDLYARIGTLENAPVRLVLYPKDITYTDDEGNRRAGTARVVGLVLAMTIQEAAAMMAAKSRDLLTATAELRVLGSGEGSEAFAAAVLEDLEKAEKRDEVEIGEEFHPESGPDPFSVSGDEDDALDHPPEVGTGPPPPIGDASPVLPTTDTPPERDLIVVTGRDLESLSSAVRSLRRLGKLQEEELRFLRAVYVDAGEEGDRVHAWIEELRHRIAATQVDPSAYGPSEKGPPPPPAVDPDQGYLLPPTDTPEEE